MATLTNTKIKDTYDGLLKTTDNEALDVSGVTLIEDGLGNASALSVGRSGNGVSVSGNLAVDTNTLYVDAANNRVGINKTPSSESLEVSGNINTTGSLTAGSGLICTNGPLVVDSGATSQYGVFDTDATNGGYMSFLKSGTTLADIGNAGQIVSGGSANDFGINVRPSNNLIFGTANQERMRIDSSGNVGIGVSPSGAKMHIVSTNSTAKFESSTTGLFNTYKNSNGDFAYVGTGSQTVSGGSANDLGIQAVNNFVIATGGNTERMRIDSSGNVGIGESVPLVPLHISKNTASGENIALILDNNNTTVNSEVGLLFRSAVGSTNTDFQIATINTAANQANLVFRSDGGTERMRITSDGKFFIGKTSYANAGAGFMFDIDANDGADLRLTRANNTNSQTHIRFFTNAGTGIGNISTTTSSTSYNTSSDYRLKENVVEMTGALDRVDALKPSRFNFIGDEKTVDGFLAHEVQAIVPEAVTGEKDATEEYEVTPAVLDEDGNVIEEAVMGTRPVYQGIDQSKIVPLLVGAIKELRAEIELLKAK